MAIRSRGEHGAAMKPMLDRERYLKGAERETLSRAALLRRVRKPVRPDKHRVRQAATDTTCCRHSVPMDSITTMVAK